MDDDEWERDRLRDWDEGEEVYGEGEDEEGERSLGGLRVDGGDGCS